MCEMSNTQTTQIVCIGIETVILALIQTVQYGRIPQSGFPSSVPENRGRRTHHKTGVGHIQDDVRCVLLRIARILQ